MRVSTTNMACLVLLTCHRRNWLATVCGYGPDECFAIADDNGLAGERLELRGEVAGAAVFVDVGVVVGGPEVAEFGVRVCEQVMDDGQDPPGRRLPLVLGSVLS
jgi:hypothetical protein